MQTLLHLYTLLLLIYLTLFHSLQEIRANKLLWIILLLIISTTAIHTYAIFEPQHSPFLLIFIYLAQSLYIPAVYLYFHNQFSKDHIRTKDLLHLTPFLFMCLNLFTGYFITAKWAPLSAMILPPILIINGSTAFYFLLVLLLIKPKVKGLFKTTKRSHRLFSVIRSKLAKAKRINTSYSVDGFSQEKIAHMNTIIQQAMGDSRKPFLQQRYSLKDLAADTQIPLHHLSAFINNYWRMNFNDFINEYRVQHSQEKMRNHECTYKKLETIAKESGFNNRNTFTAAFKKVAGLTPSEFLKEVNLNESLSEASSG